MSSMHKTNNEKIKARPSKLFLYEKLYTDLDSIRENNTDFSITDFACGESKSLEALNPSYYQGIDFKEDLISASKKKFKNKNYNFYYGDMQEFNTKIKTNIGLCIQTLGINIKFKEEILLKCLNNLNDHISKDGFIIFNLSKDLYEENKIKINEFCRKNYSKYELTHYGLFNERYNYRITRFIIFLEKIIPFNFKFKNFVYIICKNKIN